MLQCGNIHGRQSNLSASTSLTVSVADEGGAFSHTVSSSLQYHWRYIQRHIVEKMGGNWCIIHYVRFIPSSSITNQSVLRVTDLSTTRSLWIHSAPDQNKVRKSQPMIWSSNDSTYLYFYYDIQRELQHQNSNPFLAYCTRQPAAFCFHGFGRDFTKKLQEKRMSDCKII